MNTNWKLIQPIGEDLDVIVITGPQCCGKSYLAHKLCKGLNSKYILDLKNGFEKDLKDIQALIIDEAPISPNAIIGLIHIRELTIRFPYEKAPTTFPRPRLVLTSNDLPEALQ